MVNLKETMRVLIYITSAFLLVLSQVYADTCDDALLEFQMNADTYLEKRLMAYDDVKRYSELFTQFKSQVGNESCAASAIAQTEDSRKIVKEKRIETIQKYLKLGIKEEGGKDLSSEYDFLTGKSKKYKYDFEDVFSPGAGKVTPPARVYEDIVIPSKPPKVSASGCSDIINQNETVNLENVRNQDSVGWCYAYTAADLLSFKLNKKISAVSLYSSGQDIELDIKDSTSQQGGDIKSSIDNYLAKKNGLCLEEDLPSNDFKFCTDRSYNDFLNTFLNAVRERKLDQNLCLEKNLAQAFPGTDLNFIRNHANRFGTKKIIEALYDNQCKKLSFKGLKINAVNMYTSRYQPEAVMKKLDEQVSKGEIIGVAYDYNKLNGEPGTGGHASIVVGRRTNSESGACEYLVRNSWGKNCDQTEDDGLSCHKNCDSNGCRYSGHFWVSGERLKKSILGVSYLQ